MNFNLKLLVLFLGLFSFEGLTNEQMKSLKGQWVTEANGQVMLNPQTSGLKHWRGKLLTISDASADISQVKQLHVIDPESAKLSPISMKMMLSPKVKQSCFASYLAAEPDFEALVVDPNDDNVILMVTEDATRSGDYSAECQQRFKQTGSTKHPSLLVRLLVKDLKTVVLTHVRPLQFANAFAVGDFPNDGLEGLAFGPNQTLYLAMEKDKRNQARIFSLNITDDFWSSTDFAKVSDPQLSLPKFDKGAHPINGMDYLAVPNHPGYLVAAARNDDQLWFIDLAKKQTVKVLDLDFWLPNKPDSQSCEDWDKMNNTSLEGVAVFNEQIWLINDPWKRNYMKNVTCAANSNKFKKMAPLLFSMPVPDLAL